MDGDLQMLDWVVIVYSDKGKIETHDFHDEKSMLAYLVSHTTEEVNTSFRTPGGQEFSVMRKPKASK
jgi:hypothetical protein